MNHMSICATWPHPFLRASLFKTLSVPPFLMIDELRVKNLVYNLCMQNSAHCSWTPETWHADTTLLWNFGPTWPHLLVGVLG